MQFSSAHQWNISHMLVGTCCSCESDFLLPTLLLSLFCSACFFSVQKRSLYQFQLIILCPKNMGFNMEFQSNKSVPEQQVVNKLYVNTVPFDFNVFLSFFLFFFFFFEKLNGTTITHFPLLCNWRAFFSLVFGCSSCCCCSIENATNCGNTRKT